MTLTVTPQPDESVSELCRRLARQLAEREATPLQLLVFGKARGYAFGMDELRKAFGRVNWPVTWVEGALGHGRPMAGIQAYAFTGDVERIHWQDRAVGSVFTEGGARQCLIGGLNSTDKTLPRSEHTQRTLEMLESVLTLGGFELADTVRTWFFLEDILSWYDDFNRARTGVYSGIRFRTQSLPASTGVGAKNPAGSALALAGWAFRPLQPEARAQEVASPLQCAAPAYGSSFSRAMELASNGGRRLLISGTASIAPGGKTLWLGDVQKQVELTMDVVREILHARGFTFDDLTRATAYFRRPEDTVVFSEWLVANRLERMPLVSAQCAVCRDDLLFELEADAEKAS
ncbi:MAG: Rid family hydrolase [Verrucomicrobiota bacterium]